MDAEEAHQLLTEVQLCCLISEAEKRGRGHKAKYRNILATLADEDGSGATQPEASRVLHAARSALAPPTLLAASVYCPNLSWMCAYAYLDGPRPSSGPEVPTIL